MLSYDDNSSIKKVLVNGLIAEIRMKVNPDKDIIQINGNIIKKFVFKDILL